MARRNARSVAEMRSLLADRMALNGPRPDAEIDADLGPDDSEDREPPCLSDDELEARSYVERRGRQFIRPGY
jgi:hypothetical protein